jgi:hypothetical protein
MNKVLTGFLISVLLVGLVGCSGHNARYVEPATVGGVSGALAGAGTGALIGSMIASGDVGASALLGAGIGLPIGAAALVYYQMQQEETELERNEDIINSNRQLILLKEESILALKSQVESDLRGLNLDYKTPVDPNEGKLYLGPTIGVYR